MAQIKYIGANTDGLYNDGDQVEQDILAYVKAYNACDYWKILKEDSRWPVFYHLTAMRENILNWYDFAPDADVLEIGGGMGALTGLLCRRARSVTTVELTRRRAEVIRARHDHFENLTILVGNFNDMTFPQKYDYITLIGVLEYAPGFTPGGNPADFLRRVRGLLKPGGKLLIAIENRFGLKYWCGANEDHTGKPFDGINGYTGQKDVRTFSRSELSDLLQECGFGQRKFYYPLPDYKLPQLMYSDERLPQRIPARLRNYCLDDPRLLADEKRLYADVISNGVFPFFANSFFVECAEGDAALCGVTFASFTPDRVPERQIITTIWEDQVVRKYAAQPAGEAHIRRIFDCQALYRGNNLLPYRLVDGHLEMPVYDLPTLDAILCDCIGRGDLAGTKRWIERFQQEILRSSERVATDQGDVLRHGFLDLTFWNCFVKGDALYCFDQEWVVDDIPPAFILFRNILILYADNPALEDGIPRDVLFQECLGSPDALEPFYEFERAFYEETASPDQSAYTYLDRFRGSVGGADQPQKAEPLTGKVYFDGGRGYSEQTAMIFRYDRDEDLKVEFEVPERTVAVRFDPVEGHWCELRDLKVDSDIGPLRPGRVNGSGQGGAYIFQTTDPQMEFVLKRPVQWISITAAFELTDSADDDGIGDPIEREARLRRQLVEARNAYLQVTNSLSWRATKPFRACGNTLRRMPAVALLRRGLRSLRTSGARYTWIKVLEKLNNRRQTRRADALLKDTEQALAEQRAKAFPRKILFSIVVPLYNTPESFLREMIGSVQAQTYANWELCLADGSDAAHGDVGDICRALAEKDRRIKYKKLERNLGISGNTNACLEMAAGAYIGLLDHDDILRASALFRVMQAICDRDADFVYTDETTFESPNIQKILSTHFKPDFAVDNLRANNYICHFTVFARRLLEQAGPFRPAYDGSQDHDLMLRLTAIAERIVHIPEILYFWRSHPSSVAQDIGVKEYAIAAGRKAVRDSVTRAGYPAVVESSRAFPAIYRLHYELKRRPKVSILIATRDNGAALKRCLDSIFEKTTYPDWEIVLADGGSTDRETLDYYDRLRQSRPAVSFCAAEGQFNRPRLINAAAARASGDCYVLLHDDVEVITPEWIEEMLMYAQRDDVSAVGAMLYFPNDMIQHAGFFLGHGPDGIAGRIYYRGLRNAIGYMGRLAYSQNLSAVSTECMMVKAAAFRRAGGLDEALAAYGDIDFCLKLRSGGNLIVWTPYAELYHHESGRRADDAEGRERLRREAAEMKRRWADALSAGDPYYNPNFAPDRADYSL